MKIAKSKMGLEIERKFLVDTTKLKPENQGTAMVQAYLGLAPNPTVRVRIKGAKAFLTIKGRSETISRPEFEYEIPVDDATELMKLAVSNPVEKIRYEIWHDGFMWEVDFFKGKNEGLVLAEIELSSESQTFEKPEWILNEVSSDPRYYNSYLSECPFQDWK
ncbi:MAG TPA: CYTH domain-containing protein [Prolixibacteraceae bacterium]|nr:CYTH domain-containing protein [Prolixibacteraceae bacterium]HPR85074.1 CYTH domain-containing protein [Prolixibacteraceae bacterium]